MVGLEVWSDAEWEQAQTIPDGFSLISIRRSVWWINEMYAIQRRSQNTGPRAVASVHEWVAGTRHVFKKSIKAAVLKRSPEGESVSTDHPNPIERAQHTFCGRGISKVLAQIDRRRLKSECGQVGNLSCNATISSCVIRREIQGVAY